MKIRKFCYMYHICKSEDKYNFEEGYIGISTKPTKRWNSGYRDNPHLKNALKLYKTIKYVFYFGTVKECQHKERLLRPQKNIGWNIAAGGGIPPSPKGTSNCISRLPQERRRKDYKPSVETKALMSLAQTKRSKEMSDRMLKDNPAKGLKGADRFGFKGYYVTPKGVFDNRLDPAKIFDVHVMTITKRCVTGGIVKYSRWNPKEWTGKTWQELGWSFITKEDFKNE